MQNVEHDMDDLFRKAAEHYSLKEDEGNWDMLAGKLQIQKTALPVKTKKRKKFYIFSLLILLFLFLAGIFYKYADDKPGKYSESKDKRSPGSMPVANKSNPEKIIPPQQNIEEPIVRPGEEALMKRKTGEPVNKNHTLLTIISDNKENHDNKIITPGHSISNMDNYDGPDKIAFSIPFIPVITDGAAGRNYKLKIPSPAYTGIIFNRPFVEEHNGKNKRTTTAWNQKGLYAGFIAGPDFSSVKFQSISKTGYNAGLIAGYKFHNKLSIETGLIFNQKYYYSMGTHFSMSKVGPAMPVGMEILTVNQKNNILEIPLKLKYDFGVSAKAKFFGSAGVSSYILLKENNNYFTRYNNSEEYINASYTSDVYYWFSAINISLGIERNLGKKSSLRFEPYFKIPLKGMGMGNMQVTGTGFNIGISRFFTR